MTNPISVLFSCLVMSDSATPWTVAQQASLSITNSWSLLKLMSIESVMPSNHLIFCRPFSPRFQSFPGSGSFLAPQFENINSSTLSLLYVPTLTSICDYWKTIALIVDFDSKVMSLIFNILSRFVKIQYFGHLMRRVDTLERP